MNLPLSDVKKQ